VLGMINAYLVLGLIVAVGDGDQEGGHLQPQPPILCMSSRCVRYLVVVCLSRIKM